MPPHQSQEHQLCWMEATAYKMINPFDFADKTILISGAAAGIGLKTAKQLDKAGAKLILLDRDEIALDKLAVSFGSRIFRYRVDMAETASLSTHLKKIIASVGPLDGLVYCVGARSRRPLKLIKPIESQKIMNVNFFAFIEMVRLVTRKGNFKSGLSIVGISSIASIRGGSGVTLYAASKAAMDASVRCLAKELAPKNIRLNTVTPAQIDTPAYRQLLEQSANQNDPTLARQYLGLGEQSDVANIIMFLLSPASKFITGSAIPVDGGFLST